MVTLLKMPCTWDHVKNSNAYDQYIQMTIPVLPPTGRGLDEEGGSSYCPLLE